MKSTGPYAISLGTPLQETPPDAGVQWGYVVISNLSPMLCAVEGGYWLQPWTAQVYPVATADTVNITPQLTTNPGTTTGNITIDWYLAGENPPGSFPVSLTSQAITAAITSGAITALQPQAAMGGSPVTPAGPGQETFTWPSGGPYSSVTITVSNASPTVLTVTGATTGQVYLKETVSRGRWALDISSIVEPAGVTVSYALTTGWTGLWGITLNLVASTQPLTQRPLYGPGDSGPTSMTSARVQSVPGAGRSSAALIGGEKGNSFRIYAAWLTVEQVAAGAQGSAYLSVGTLDFLVCAYGAAANSNSISISIPGGYLLDSNSIGLNPIAVEIDNSAGPPSAVGGIFYSEES